jgi:hypothetical protein
MAAPERTHNGLMTRLTHKHRSEVQSAKAEEEMRRCTDWVVQFMRNSEPRFLTKSELCGAAMKELKCQRTPSTQHGSMRLRKQADMIGINRFVVASALKIETLFRGLAIVPPICLLRQSTLFLVIN